MNIGIESAYATSRGRWWALGGVSAAIVAAAVVAVVLATTRSHGSHGPASSSPATTAALPVITGTLLTQSGSGTATTATFAAGSPWELDWSYDCSGAPGDVGNLVIDVSQATASAAAVSYAPVEEIGKGGSGAVRYANGGQLYLVVHSECSWTLTAKG